jgi:hypothetical protein
LTAALVWISLRYINQSGQLKEPSKAVKKVNARMFTKVDAEKTKKVESMKAKGLRWLEAKGLRERSRTGDPEAQKQSAETKGKETKV